MCKGLRVQRSKDVAEGIVRRNAIGKINKLLKEIHLIARKLFNAHPVVFPGDYGTNGDKQNAFQRMFTGAGNTWIGKIGEVLEQRSGTGYFEPRNSLLFQTVTIKN